MQLASRLPISFSSEKMFWKKKCFPTDIAEQRKIHAWLPQNHAVLPQMMEEREEQRLKSFSLFCYTGLTQFSNLFNSSESASEWQIWFFSLQLWKLNSCSSRSKERPIIRLNGYSKRCRLNCLQSKEVYLCSIKERNRKEKEGKEEKNRKKKYMAIFISYKCRRTYVWPCWNPGLHYLERVHPWVHQYLWITCYFQQDAKHPVIWLLNSPIQVGNNSISY